MSAKILIVDDENDIRSLLRDILEDEGYTLFDAAHSMQAEYILSKESIDLVILDIWLENSEKDGVSLLKTIKDDNKDLPVLMISGHGNIETAVQTTKLGAYDFIEKPFKTESLLVSIKNALEASFLRAENKRLKSQSLQETADLVGDSDTIKRLKRQIEKVAPTESRVLITGKSGTGKGLAAKVIHQKSRRTDAPFYTLSCAILSGDKIEAELFGSEAREGLLEKLAGGTLFLDEIADMALETQGRFLRVLQEQRFYSNNKGEEVDIDIRLIASTSQDLESLVLKGTFKEELYYRLNVVPIAMPSLSARGADIKLLSEEIIAQLAIQSQLQPKKLSAEVLALFERYQWPGNIRELKNVLEWLLIMSPSNKSVIDLHDLPSDMRTGLQNNQSLTLNAQNASSQNMLSFNNIESMPLKEARNIFEKEYLQAQLERFEGNITKTAKFVGMERTALHRKIKNLSHSDEPESEEKTANG